MNKTTIKSLNYKASIVLLALSEVIAIITIMSYKGLIDIRVRLGETSGQVVIDSRFPSDLPQLPPKQGVD